MSKPRLYRKDGQWECSTGAHSGRGDTPIAAFIRWLAVVMSRYDFEREA